jgi:hypothetical protein
VLIWLSLFLFVVIEAAINYQSTECLLLELHKPFLSSDFKRKAVISRCRSQIDCPSKRERRFVSGNHDLRLFRKSTQFEEPRRHFKTMITHQRLNDFSPADLPTDVPTKMHFWIGNAQDNFTKTQTNPAKHHGIPA